MTLKHDPKPRPGGTAVRGDDARKDGFPAADPVTSLRLVGRDVELHLSPEQHAFTLGSAAAPEVDLTVTSATPPEHVSRVHLRRARRRRSRTLAEVVAAGRADDRDRDRGGIPGGAGVAPTTLPRE